MKSEKLVPNIRFKGFTNTWEKSEISNLFNITRGYVLPTTMVKQFISKDFIYPVFSSQTLNNGLLGYYNEYLYNDCITWTTDGANAGTVNYRKGPFYCTNVCGVLLEKNLKPTRCLAEILNNKAYKYVSKVGNPKLMNNVMQSIDITYPKDEDEDKKISELFNILDSIITFYKRKSEKLENLKKSLLEKMFVSDGEQFPAIRFKGFTNTWEKRYINEILQFERPDNYMIKGSVESDGNIPVLTANKAFILGYTNETNIYNKGHCILFDDFTLDTKYVSFPFMINSSALKILTNRKNGDDLMFNYYLLKNTRFIINGHARHYISYVQTTSVLVPNKNEATKIRMFYQKLDSLITLHKRKCEKLENIKQFLLEKMFC
ncbi:restriction endonuclease subunit S [Mycoplasma sp. Z1473D]